jgi:hypothetical protein
LTVAGLTERNCGVAFERGHLSLHFFVVAHSGCQVVSGDINVFPLAHITRSDHRFFAFLTWTRGAENRLHFGWNSQPGLWSRRQHPQRPHRSPAS